MENINQDSSAVFQIEVYFGEGGEVKFTPSLDELIDVIAKYYKIILCFYE